MIKIEGLTKQYRSKAKSVCTALDSIDLILPNRGMVFIIGKSGSGKSTLLNVLGGLDSFNSGDITVFGNSLASFSTSDYEAYRSDLVGFVFQDYHLIEELTVLENITLFAPKDNAPIDFDRVVDTVGISDLLDRHPSELSGGQRQRVAIARCIIKQPKVLLCDEPTGNLDKKSSTHVMELLSELSRERLVIIVSHNLSEAELYADRIIELADGRIVSDVKKQSGYTDDFSIDDGTVVLPYRKRLSEDEVVALNARLTAGELKKIHQNSSGFTDTEEVYEPNPTAMTPRRMRTGNILRIFRNFLLSKKRQSIGAVLIASIMFFIFAVIQAFVSFDANGALTYALNERDPLLVVEKDYSSFPYNIYDDVSPLGKSYPLYSQTIWTPNPHGSSWDIGRRLSDDTNLSDLYIHETYGLLACDDEYLCKRFGVNGNIPLLAGDLDDARSGGILITDYFADSFIKHQEAANRPYHRTYEELIGVISPVGYNLAGRIAGIINTGYKEKYADLIEEYLAFDEEDSALSREEFEQRFRSDRRYIALMDDIKINLGISYTLDQNYAENVDFSELTLVKTSDLYIAVDGVETCATNLYYASSLDRNQSIEYGDDEIGLPYIFYNTIFGTNYTESDLYQPDDRFGQEIVIKRYVDNNPKKGLVYEKSLRIKCLTRFDPEINDTNLRYFKKADWQPSRLYFLEPDTIPAIVDYITENEYTVVSTEQSTLMSINGIIRSFHDLFSFIQVLLLCLVGCYLFGYGFKSIRTNAYQIGVIKALGASNRDVCRIFVTKTLIIGMIIAVVSVLLSLFFIGTADGILVSSIEAMSKTSLDGLEIIQIIPSLLALDALLLLGVVILSSLLTALLLRSIKPVEIIKAKE